NSSEAVLVLAKGTIDPDAAAPTTDPDETSGEDTTDICTGQVVSGPTTDSCALLIDTSNGQTIKTYQVANSDFQALALNPLVTDCSGGIPAGTACASSYTPQ